MAQHHPLVVRIGASGAINRFHINAGRVERWRSVPNM
jgi:hypothetical protein